VAVVLARAADATRGMRAVLSATAIAHSGRAHRFDAPAVGAHIAAVSQALERARARASDLEYIELSGTGAIDDDAVEVHGLASVIAAADTGARPLVGSVKANLGDLGPAAGLAALVKAVLGVERGEVPAQAQFDRPHPRLGLYATPLDVAREARALRADGRRLAGVSSLSSAGQSAFAVVERARSDGAPAGESLRPLHLLCVSAKTDAALRALARRYADYLDQPTAPGIADVCHAANAGRAHMRHRLAVTADSTASLRDRLAAFARGQAAPGALSRAADADPPRLMFLLTGRGAAPDLCRRLYDTEPHFQSIMQRCDRTMLQAVGRTLLPALYPTPQNTGESWEAMLGEPAAFAVEYALASTLQSWGVIPDAVMGEGVGELAAACISGALTFGEGLRIVAERARLLAGLATRLGRAPGPDDVGPILDDLTHAAARAETQPPTIAVVSSVTGGPITAFGADHWARQLREPPRVRDALAWLLEQGHRAAVELGPRPGFDAHRTALLGDASPGLWMSLHRAGVDDWEPVLDLLARLYTSGRSPDWERFDAHTRPRVARVPTYPFERGS
jgi:acyl transferase domain-containing protein